MDGGFLGWVLAAWVIANYAAGCAILGSSYDIDEQMLYADVCVSGQNMTVVCSGATANCFENSSGANGGGSGGSHGI